MSVSQCFFEYGQRWPELRTYIERLIGERSLDGAPRDSLDIILEAMETRDRDIEDHLNNRPCGGGGGCVQSWAWSAIVYGQGDWSEFHEITLDAPASLVVVITGSMPAYQPYVDGLNVIGPNALSGAALTYVADLGAGSHDIGFSGLVFESESVEIDYSMSVIATCPGTNSVQYGGA